MELRKLGTIESNGNLTYQPWRNPLLQQRVVGYNLDGTANPMNPGTFATPSAAAAIAGALGGQVVTDPQSNGWSTSARVLAIQLPDQEPVNAGAICSIMGNDCAYSWARPKSWSICELLGLPFDATMADRIWQAISAEIV